MAGTDWCHMAARVERTSLHRRLKGAELPYEDEKFSYVIATRTPVDRAAARIIRRPDVQKGFVAFYTLNEEAEVLDVARKAFGGRGESGSRSRLGNPTCWPALRATSTMFARVLQA